MLKFLVSFPSNTPDLERMLALEHSFFLVHHRTASLNSSSITKTSA
jgi:hypothetical protein